MVTRSIVGRVLILAVLIVSLGVITQAALIITHGPAKKDGIAPQGKATAAADQQDTAPIRVVYPGPLGDSPAPARKIADAAPASPLASPPAAMPSLSAASVGAIAQASASQEDFDTGAQTTAAAPSPAAATPPAAASNVEAAPAAPAVETASLDPVSPDSAVPPPQTTEASGKGVNINSASAETLNHLQGGGRIGQTIVQHRPYKSVDDLVKKKVLRRAVYDQIKNQIAAQ